MYEIFFTKNVLENDMSRLKAAKLDGKAKRLIDIVSENPYAVPPGYEKLRGDLAGALSRRINVKHRFVYQVIEEKKTVKVLSMWTHYDF